MALVALNASFLPWAFGGVDAWSQWVSLALATASLVVALLPRSSSHEGVLGDIASPWRRLRRFPLFWAGLLLLGYVVVQALNPAFRYYDDAQGWWLRRLEHLTWLPSGMIVPYQDMNPWRALVVWGAAWATLCAVYVGITRRSSLGALLIAMTANAFLFSLFGIVQKASGTLEVYGTRVVEFHYFFGAIIYKNQAAAYLSLLAFFALALTLRAFRKSAGASPLSVVFLLFAIAIIAGLLLTYSFSGVALFSVALAAALGIALLSWKKASGPARSFTPLVVVIGVLVISAASIGTAVGHEQIAQKVRELSAGEGAHSTKTRMLAAEAGWKMLQDEWLLGWGAGCFRYGFTKYQHAVPELTQWRYLHLRWEHVHNDWLETAIELGVVGLLPLLCGGVWWFRQTLRLGAWRDPLLQPILCGLVALLVHGTFDFPWPNPAVLLTAAVAVAITLRWGELGRRAITPS